MSLSFDQAAEKVDARLAGAIEAGEAAVALDAVPTTAGTDVDGPMLSHEVLQTGLAAASRLTPFLATAEEVNAVALARWVVGTVNGAALQWFWLGWEIRRAEVPEIPEHVIDSMDAEMWGERIDSRERRRAVLRKGLEIALRELAR